MNNGILHSRLYGHRRFSKARAMDRDDQEELKRAELLLWDLHKLGGVRPDHLSKAEILNKYRKLVSSEGALDVPDGTAAPQL